MIGYGRRVLEPREATVSLRFSLPFFRVTGSDPHEVEILAREGITLRDFANPDTRIRHRASIELLERGLVRYGPLLGLHAAERCEAGDFDALEYASRSCANLREANECSRRYMYLMHGAQEIRLIEEGDLAIWQQRITDDVPQPPAANDFALASAVVYARRYTGKPCRHIEVHFQHAVPTDMAEYVRFFGDARFRMGMPCNALIFERSQLDLPMSHAHPALHQAFEMHARALLERLKRTEGVSGRVRQLLVDQLRGGDVSMPTIARRLAMSVATLRRRLAEEGTSHTEILDDVRAELAQKYLLDPSLAISEVAFLLGFAHVTAFYKAFRRWSKGLTPAEFRAQNQHR